MTPETPTIPAQETVETPAQPVEVEGLEQETLPGTEAGPGTETAKAEAEAEAPSAAPKPEPRPESRTELPQPVPQDSYLAQLTQQFRDGQRRNAELETRIAEAMEQQAIRQYQAELEMQYPGIDVSRLVAAYRGTLEQQRAAQQRERDTQQRYEAMQQEQQARITLAQRFAQEFGMPVNELAARDVEGPKHMRDMAKLWKAEQELSKLRQAQVKPQTPTNSNQSRARVPATVANIDKLYMDFEQQHPGERNPYEAQYRRIIG